MSITSFKYNLTFIVLCVGMTLIHAGNEGKSKEGIKLYYTDWSAPCRSVMMMGRMLDIKFEMKHVDLEKHEQYDPAFEKINPQRTVPTIDDKGFILWESRAIMVYLVQEYGTGEETNLFPDDFVEQANVNKMLQFDMGNLGIAFINLYSPWMFFKTPRTEFKKNKLKTALQLFETLLENKYAAGDSLTVADVALVANILNIKAVGEDLTTYPKINKWLENCKANIKGFEDVNHKGIQLVEEKTKKRKEEELTDMVEESISNRDVYNAVTTLLRAVQSQVISTQHLQYLKPLMTTISSLVKA